MMIKVPIVVTLVGIVTAVSPVHDKKAYSPNCRVSRMIIIDDDYGTNDGYTSRNNDRR